MNIWFLLSLAAMVAAFGLACRNGFAFGSQVQQQPHPPRTYLTFMDNVTNWFAVGVANPLAARLIEWHADSWPKFGVVIVAVFVFALGVLMIIPLLQDSKTTPSAYFQNGRLTFAGVIYQLLVWPYQVSVFVTFYALTPAADVTKPEVFTVTLFLLLTWGVSTLQPPIKVHGKTNGMAWAGAIAGWIAIVAGLIYQLKFA